MRVAGPHQIYLLEVEDDILDQFSRQSANRGLLILVLMQVVEEQRLAGPPKGGNLGAAPLSNVARSLIAARPLVVLTWLAPRVEVEEVRVGLVVLSMKWGFVVHLFTLILRRKHFDSLRNSEYS